MILEALLFVYGVIWLVIKSPLISIIMKPICWIAVSIGLGFAFYLGLLIVISVDSTQVIQTYNLLKNIMGPIGFMGVAINSALTSSVRKYEVQYYLIRV